LSGHYGADQGVTGGDRAERYFRPHPRQGAQRMKPSQEGDSVDITALKKIVEGALLAAGQVLTLERLAELFDDGQRPSRDELLAALAALDADCGERSFELKHTASGYRFQVRQELAPWLSRLWEEKP